MMNNERRRHSLSLSRHMRVARSSIAFCIASLLTHAHVYGANLGECKKIRSTSIEEEEEEKSVSFMHKRLTVVDMRFFSFFIS
jgi:hypothetical protein